MSENDVDFKAATGHGATCPTCGEACDIFAVNPMRWPVTLPHPHEPGVIGYHHMGCVVGTIEDLSRKLEEARHRIAELEAGLMPRELKQSREEEVIYAVEGPINPRSGAPTLYPALGEPQAVKDLRSELEEARGRIAELEAKEKDWARYMDIRNASLREVSEDLDKSRARIADLEVAIKPFAEIARTFGPRCSDSDKAHGPITVGDLRAAHRAMIKAENDA